MQKAYELIVRGKGGHASMPQKANNPIPIAARLISQLSGMSTDIRVVGWEAGGKGNIIPEEATIRIIYEQKEKQQTVV